MYFVLNCVFVLINSACYLLNYFFVYNTVHVILQIQSSIRLFLYQKLLIKSAKNLTLAFGLNSEELLPSVYFIRNRGICQLDVCDYRSVRLLISFKLSTMNYNNRV